MTPELHRALSYRAVIVFFSALTLAGLMIGDELAQPETIKVPERMSWRVEEVRR